MDAAAKMELFQNLFYVSAAIAVVGLGLAVFFFFFFDIRNVYALMTGKAKRQTIERMAEQNSRTGHLHTHSGNIREPNAPRVQHPSQVVTAEIQPTVDFNAAPESMETTILSDSGETTILQPEPQLPVQVPAQAGETAILSQPQQGETTILSAPEPSAPAFRFDITESTMVINTDEII